MIKMTSFKQELVLLFLTGVIFSCSYVCASDQVSFSVTHRDAESSPLRGVEADPADLPEDMPLRAFVAAGRALWRREERLQTELRGGRGRPSLARKVPYQSGGLLLTVGVGTPPQNISFLLDTGSEVCFTECSPCLNCTKTRAARRFAYQQSSSLLPVYCDSFLCRGSVGLQQTPQCDKPTTLCHFEVAYGDQSFEKGFLSVDSFDLAPAFSRPFVFGCAQMAYDSVSQISYSGLLGMDAGPFSFSSQLLAGMPAGVPRKFAHCAPDLLTNVDAPGTIAFGNYKLPEKLRYTPLAPPYSPLGSVYYYVQLQGITVGQRLIKVDMEAAERGKGGGSIFDSGTGITRFVKPLYDEVVGEMRRQTAHLRPISNAGNESDLCYKVAETSEKLPQVPTMILHFAGGLDMELGPESTLLPTSVAGGSVYVCLAFQLSPVENVNLIGLYQQQNYWVEYNLGTSSLGLAKANCARNHN